MMNAREVASYIGVNVNTVYRKAQSGELPCYRLGTAIRFKLEEIELAMKGEEKCQKKEHEGSKPPRR